jgi:hypothetical protein
MAHLEASIARSTEAADDSALADCLRHAAVTSDLYEVGRTPQTADAALTEALDLYRRAGDRWGDGYLLLDKSMVHFWRSEPEAAVAAAEQAAEVFAAIGDDAGLAWSLARQAEAHGPRGEGRKAADLARASLTMFEDLGMPSGERLAALNIAEWARFHGDPETAIRHHRYSLDISERQGYLYQMVASGSMLALSLRAAGRLTEAAECLVTTLDRAVRRSVDEQTVWVVECAAGLLATVGEAELAAELFGSAEQERRSADNPMPLWDVDAYRADRALPAAALSAASFRNAVKRGNRRSLAAACVLARRALMDLASSS